MLRILLLIRVIKFMRREIGISQLSISRVAVHSWYYITRLFIYLFFQRQRFAPTTTIVLVYLFNYLYFVSYALFLTFTLCDFSVSIKHGFQNVSPFSLLFEHFLFCITFLYFYMINNSYSHYHHYHYDYFCCYCFSHCHWHHFLFFFQFLSFYFIFEYIEYF